MGVKNYAAPAADEIEVSLFGPGYGECVVIHATENDWIVVDSCMDPETNQPVAISYLNAIGVDPASRIRVVVASHWDDDHIDGLSEVYRLAASAKFACSGALLSDQFLSIVANWRLGKLLPFGSGIDEFDAILVEMHTRAKSAKNPSCILANHNKVVWEKAGTELRALSPSDSGVIAATLRFSQIFAERPLLSRRIPLIEGNHSSVVLSLKIQGISTLLGADLQMRSDRSHGWFAIVDQFVGEKHTSYKIPHHGSDNGDHEQIWQELLASAPTSATTPFVKGSHRLPSEADCRRIIGRTPHAFLTARPMPKKIRLNSLTADKMVKENSLRSQLVPGRFGHVRMRCKVGSSKWETLLSGDAVAIEELLRNPSEVWPK